VRENAIISLLRECSSEQAVHAAEQGSENVALEEVRETIAPDTLAVEYFQCGDRILVCLLSRERLEIVPVTLASRVESVRRLLKFQLAKFRLGSKYAEAFHDSLIRSTQSHLQSLYNELLAPIRSRLNTPHLLIVPHGALHYVPFHALFDGEKYVIDDHTVSYAPSLSVYSLCVKKAVNTSGPALLMGIPDERAPLIENEIHSISSIWPSSRTYMGALATDNVLKNDGPGCRILHIATHGHFRQDSPLFSSIRMGTSFLSLYDLYQLRLPVELVTLSGCATGMNVVAAGDEMIGLARGLFQAGAQSLLLSLWDAHDASTAELMQAFYRRLQQGLSKAGALKLAMLELRERRPHPYQWAPFVLMGGYSPLANA
jgi:CHAT domain-containing protein